MITARDAKWIYEALEKAFVEETGKQWESYSHVKLKPIVTNNPMLPLNVAAVLLEIDSIEFEVCCEKT